MPLLFWKAIQKAKENGLREFDLGRTDLDDAGLLAFKDRWGGRRSILAYWRYPAPDPEKTQSAWAMRVARQMITYMPNSLLPAAGKLIYRHVG
jgi:lipid II:glycine glycyltransferase (peptidoglycan interpeptide bridge formation enzyme)